MSNNSTKRFAFSWLENRTDSNGLDGWWLSCLHHLMRDVLLYHRIDHPLRILFRPLHLVFFVDKNCYPWLWDGPEEEFLAPRFNQGVQGRWRPEETVSAAVKGVSDYLESGRIPLFYCEWFHVPFNPHYQKLRGNLHAAAILDYRRSDEQWYIVDRSALPSSRGGLENGRGWVSLEHLQAAIDGNFAWLDYSIDVPTRPWAQECRAILQESVQAMRQGHLLATPNSDHGFQAIFALRHFLCTLGQAELAAPHFRYVLGWHLPPCIRKYVIGQRRVLHLILRELEVHNPNLIAQIDVPLKKTLSLWQQVASSLVLLGLEGQEQQKVIASQCLLELCEQEEMLVDALTQLVIALPEEGAASLI